VAVGPAPGNCRGSSSSPTGCLWPRVGRLACCTLADWPLQAFGVQPP
jgi:hypothetical protein